MGQRRLHFELGRLGCPGPVPSLSTIYRVLARNTKPRVWPDIEAVQAAVDGFRIEYNTTRPHQSLDMAFPADRFTARPDGQLPLRLPPTLATVPAPRPAPSPSGPPQDPTPSGRRSPLRFRT